MAVGSSVQITTIEEFWTIARREETFFWHFVQKGQCDVHVNIKPLSDILGTKCYSGLDILVEELGIKVYESLAIDAIDFFLENGYEHHVIFQENCKCVGPKFIGFKKGKPVAGTGLRPPGITGKDKFCYCLEGITEIIYLTDPSLFE
jgi:hypothetical protein